MGSNVKVNKRTVSELNFIFELRSLIYDTEQFMVNKSKNRVSDITRRTLDSMISCLENSLAANSIMISKMTPKNDFELRRAYLQKALASIDQSEYLLDIYLCGLLENEKIKRPNNEDDKNNSKPIPYKELAELRSDLYKNSKVRKFRGRCAQRLHVIRSSIISLIKHDISVFDKKNKENIQKQIQYAKDVYNNISNITNDTIVPNIRYYNYNGNISIDVSPCNTAINPISPLIFMTKEEYHRFKNDTQLKDENVTKYFNRIEIEKYGLSKDDYKNLSNYGINQ